QPQLTVDVLRIYSIAYILITPVQMLVVALIAVGRHQILGGIVLVTALLNLGLSAILGSVIGPIGVAVGTLIMVTFDNGVVIPVIASGRLAIRRRTLYSAIVLGIAIGVGIVASSELLPVSAVPGLFARVGYCIVLTAVALAIVWRGQVFGIRPERSVVQRA
ncbi:MAG TPA: hypothetical protein VH440_03820, partial [Candidatus Limnocylindrales bacterium]